MKPKSGSTCPCSPRLLLAPTDNAYCLLNKADWKQVGTASLNEAGHLQLITIAPAMQRQGLATECWQALPDRHQPPSFDQIHERSLLPQARYWLTRLGWSPGSASIPPPKALDFHQSQLEQAMLWADQLGLAADYSQTRQLPLVVEPAQLHCLGTDLHDRPIFLTAEASQAWRNLQHAAARDHISLLPVSGFRSISYQGRLVKAKLDAGTPLDQILKVSAAPGYSEHHSGRALDLTCPDSQPLESTFANTQAYQWLTLNASRFGFSLSYPENNPQQLAFEPWHWCFQDG